MNYAAPSWDALAAMGLPAASPDAEGQGRKVTVVGGNVSKGEIIRVCTDENEIDTSKAFGPASWQRFCEILVSGDSANYVNGATFCIALEDITQNTEGYVWDFGLVQALVTTTGAYGLDRLLMPDFTNQVLVPFDGTGKAVAKTAVAISGAVTASLQWVLFSGLIPLGSTINTTA